MGRREREREREKGHNNNNNKLPCTPVRGALGVYAYAYSMRTVWFQRLHTYGCIQCRLRVLAMVGKAHSTQHTAQQQGRLRRTYIHTCAGQDALLDWIW